MFTITTRGPINSTTADFERIYRELAPLVYRTAWSVLGSREDAEDVLQTVFLKLLRRPCHRRSNGFEGIVRYTPGNSSKPRAKRAAGCAEGVQFGNTRATRIETRIGQGSGGSSGDRTY